MTNTISVFFLIIVLLAGCSGKGGGPPPPLADPQPRTEDSSLEDSEIFDHTSPAWPALALLQTGENPLWFELGQEGPNLIESPAAAALTPYAPWPHARYITGMALWKDFLVMTVNRDGFLILGLSTLATWSDQGDLTPTETTELILYRAADNHWDPHTTESFFIWDDKPAALLYRNDFFAEPTAPSPRPQVYVLDFSSPVPLGALVPALENYPTGGPWETELLRRGPDGVWYYRMKEKGAAQNVPAYFSAADLLDGDGGERISFGRWMDSDRPESPENTPPNLALVLANMAEIGGHGSANAVRAVSPDFEGLRFFSSAANVSIENLELLFGFCRGDPKSPLADPKSPPTEPLALAILPDGRGFCSFGMAQDVRPFSLSPLPENFVYTGIAVLGKVIAASWEEQQEAGIGAAGFMVVTLPNP